MAQSSKSYVGIARGIKSHEISTKSSIENLKNTITSLRGKISSLNYEISGLNAELAAARADVDENGDPNYALISQLEQQINMKELDLSIAEQSLDSAIEGEREKQQELSEVQEEKAQTLFEIQERARTTSKNINAAGGMYGAYAGIGQSLQQSFQSSFSSLSSAASILGGTVAGAVAGGMVGGGSSRSASAASSSRQNGDSASAFISQNRGSYPPTVSAGKYGTEKIAFHGGSFGNTASGVKSESINPQKKSAYNTSQESNTYLIPNTETDGQQTEGSFFSSQKTSSGADKNFCDNPKTESITKIKRKQLLDSLRYPVTPIVSSPVGNNSDSSSDDSRQRVNAAELKKRGFNHSIINRTSSNIEQQERLSVFGITKRSKSNDNRSGDVSTPKNQILSQNQSPQRLSAANQILKQPRSLSFTGQSWTESSDGTLIYNAPTETGKKLDFHQGKAEITDPKSGITQKYWGTCGLVSCENIIRLAGLPVSEETMVLHAVNNSLCTSNTFPESNGGTCAESRKKLLEYYGIPSHTEQQSVQTIADAVSSGHGVIASVHAGMLYYNRRVCGLNDLHAITVTSVKKDKQGNILGFYVCDSNEFNRGGTGSEFYSTATFEAALSMKKCNITDTIIR